MRIVVDMQACQALSKDRGIGRYSFSFAQAIARQAGKHEIWLMLNDNFPETVASLKEAFNTLIPAQQIVTFSSPKNIAEHNPKNIWRARMAEMLREQFLAELKPDIVHVSSLFEGFADASVLSTGAYFANTVTLYDLIPYMQPEVHLQDLNMRNWYYKKIQHIKRADALLAISGYSRQEAVEVLSLPEEKVFNVSCAVEEYFRKFNIPLDIKARLLSSYGLTRPFVMYTGGINPRKNIEGLIKAYAALPSLTRSRHQLAIVCAMQPEQKNLLARLVSSLGLMEDEVIFTNFVPESDLVVLYNLCKLLVFPSFYEGFGLPVLEAMSCGAPVIGSNTSSLPEVIGRADALFDPYNTSAITNALQNALSNELFLEDLRQHSLVQAKKFSWDESARQAIHAFEFVGHQNKAFETKSFSISKDRPRLAFISPLPPEKSGISDYSAELLPELGRFYDVSVVVDQTQVDNPWIKANFPIKSIQWFEENADKFNRIIYQFGNSEFHKHMFDLLKRHPGVVVLHDFYLSNIKYSMDITGYSPNAFLHALYYSHGYKTLMEEKEKKFAYVVWKYPCNKDVLDNAAGIIVHSDYSIKETMKWYAPQSLPDWMHIPSLKALPKIPDKIVSREKVEISKDDFVVCSFGVLGLTKLNHVLLDAWLESKMAQDPKCKLIFVGKNHSADYEKQLMETIQNNPARDRIRVTGFASPENYRAYLSAADIAVQLRTKSRGETSAAVLDSLAYGIPLIINANGPMAEYPDDVLIKLPDQFESKDLVAALNELYENQERRLSLSEKARIYIKEFHHPVIVAEKYQMAIENVYRDSKYARYQNILDKMPFIDAPLPPTKDDLLEVVFNMTVNIPQHRQKYILLDISELVIVDGKSGIQRVVRNITWNLIKNSPEGFRVEPVYITDTNQLKFARKFTCEMLGVKASGLQDDFVDIQQGDVYLCLDLILTNSEHRDQTWKYLKMKGVAIHIIIYDLLPLLHPQFFPPEAYTLYSQWLKSAVEYSHKLIGISRSVADELSFWLEQNKMEQNNTQQVGSFHLGANIINSSASQDIPQGAEKTLELFNRSPAFLMVGTVEPRKGHAQTLAAFELLWSKDSPLKLVIVGKQGWMVDALIRKICSHPELGKRLFWLEGVNDAYLTKIYNASTCLIFASEGEGFGLPLIEAAQYKLPIITRDLPVFQEVAGEYAFYFPNDTSPEVLAKAILEWMELYRNGKYPKSDNMPCLTWEESAEQLMKEVIK